MADVSQIKLPNGSVYDLIDEKSGYITAEYIENKTDYEIPVSRVGEIVVGETAIGTDSTNFPTSKAVVDYVDERVVQEIDAIDVGVTSVNGKTGSVTLSASDVGAITQSELYDEIDNVYNDIINESGFITASDVSTNETDPTVPAWAKASTKPTYTASEVGALPSDTIIPEDKVFIAVRGTTSLSDIFTANDAGKVIFCKDGSQGVIWRFTGNSGSSTNGTATFERIDGLDGAESMHSLKYLQLSRYLGQESWAVFTRTIPYRTSDLTNDSGYLTASDIASVMTYKGTKANYAALPASGNTTGDVWHLTDTGAEWAWDGSAWQELGTAIDVSSFLTSETDPVFTASPAHGIAASDITNWNGKTAVSIVRW